MKRLDNSKFALWQDTKPEPTDMYELLCEISDQVIRESRSISVSPDDEWLNSKQAAHYLKVSVAQLHNLTSAGQIPHYKMGRANRYQKSELREFLLRFPRGKRSIV